MRVRHEIPGKLFYYSNIDSCLNVTENPEELQCLIAGERFDSHEEELESTRQPPSISLQDDVPVMLLGTSAQTCVTLSRFQGDSPHFPLVCEIRESTSTATPPEDEFDRTAMIYALWQNERMTATMRVNQARSGKMDCEQFFPDDVVHMFRPVIGSASRFCRSPSISPCPNLMRMFIRHVWLDQYLTGMRMDIINVSKPMITYYQRLGYRLVPESDFIHPRLGTDSVIMILIADPRESNMFKEINSLVPLHFDDTVYRLISGVTTFA